MTDARDAELLGFELLRVREKHPTASLSDVYDRRRAELDAVPGHASSAALEARARLNGDLARVARPPRP